MDGIVQDLSDNFAPYAATKNVMQVISRKRERGLPSPVTKSLLQSISIPEGNASRTLQALLFLRLIENDGAQTTLLEQLAHARESDYHGILAEIVREAFKRVFELVDPVEDSEITIYDAFRQFEPEAQRDRMVTFFMGMCGEAGIVTRNRVVLPNRGSGAPKRTPPATPKKAADRLSTLETDAPTDTRMLFALMQQLPPERQWTQSKRQRWLLAVQAAVDLMVEVVDEEQQYEVLARLPMGN